MYLPKKGSRDYSYEYYAMKNKSRQMAFSPPAGFAFGRQVYGSIDYHLPGLSFLYLPFAGLVFSIF